MPPLQVAWFWPMLLVPLTVAAIRGVWHGWRKGPTPVTYFGLYLVLIGLAAVIGYSATRCGNASIGNLRYMLLALFAPIGAIVLALERESRASLRVLLIAIVSMWGAVSAFNHAAQIRSFVQNQPERGYRQLAAYLEHQGIQFIVSDYWTGYFVAFITAERVRPLTNYDRIQEYVLAVHANLERAVEVRPLPAPPCAGGHEVAGFLLCPLNLQ
jgi:hypothetical protein